MLIKVNAKIMAFGTGKVYPAIAWLKTKPGRPGVFNKKAEVKFFTHNGTVEQNVNREWTFEELLWEGSEYCGGDKTYPVLIVSGPYTDKAGL